MNKGTGQGAPAPAPAQLPAPVPSPRFTTTSLAPPSRTSGADTPPNVDSQASSSSLRRAPSSQSLPTPFVDPCHDPNVFVDGGHGWIVFPWSDGDPNYGPPNVTVPPPTDEEVNYYHVFQDEGTIDPPRYSWRLKVAKEVAEQLGRGTHAPSGAPWKLKSFPADYIMTEQRKGPRDSPRLDPYLFGAKSYRFRSALEFVPHARWLITDPDRDPLNCTCKYCPSFKASARSSQHKPAPRKSTMTYVPAQPRGAGAAVGRGPRGPHRPVSEIGSVKLKMQPVDPAIRPPGVPVISSELRDVELPYGRLPPGACEGHRVGEIAWCLLDEPVADPGSDAKLDRWPVQIVGHRPRVQGKAEREYEVALMASGESAHVPESHLVPFLGGNMPKGLSQTFGSVSDHPWLHASKPKPMPKLYLLDDPEKGARAGPRPAYPVILSCLALAVQASAHLRGVCCMIDEFSRGSFQVSAPPTVNIAGPISASNAGTTPPSTPASTVDNNTYWQGMQFGLERIWVGDVVRLRLLEGEVTHMANTLAEAGKLHGKYDEVPKLGTFLLRVKAIFQNAPADVSGASQTTASGSQPKAKRRQSTAPEKLNVYIAGDVYQVVEENSSDARAAEARNAQAKQSAGASARPQFVSPLRPFLDPDVHGALPPTPPLPAGFVYYQLNDNSAEVAFSPAQLAGRLWSSLAGEKERSELAKNRGITVQAHPVLEAKDHVRARLAMAGLLPGVVKPMGVDQRIDVWPGAMEQAEYQARKHVANYIQRKEEKQGLRAEPAVAMNGQPKEAAPAPATTATPKARAPVTLSTTPAQESSPSAPWENLERKADETVTPARTMEAAKSSPLASSTAQPTLTGPTTNHYSADNAPTTKRQRIDDTPPASSDGTQAAPLPPLPPGWLEKKSRHDGSTYYAHPQLKRTQWNRPTQ